MRSQDFVYSLIVGLIAFVLFFVYLIAIGVPRTHARNLYNEAYTLSEQGQNAEARSKLEEAYAVWPEPYILDGINLIDNGTKSE